MTMENKNYMAAICKSLGVELEEPFTLTKFENCIFNITEQGFDCIVYGKYINNIDEIFHKVLKGQYRVIKLPWKPKYNELYYTFIADRDNAKRLKVSSTIWENDFCDRVMYRLGFYYKTEQEALEDIDTAQKFYRCLERIDWEEQNGI